MPFETAISSCTQETTIAPFDYRVNMMPVNLALSNGLDHVWISQLSEDSLDISGLSYNPKRSNNNYDVPVSSLEVKNLVCETACEPSARPSNYCVSLPCTPETSVSRRTPTDMKSQEDVPTTTFSSAINELLEWISFCEDSLLLFTVMIFMGVVATVIFLTKVSWQLCSTLLFALQSRANLLSRLFRYF